MDAESARLYRPRWNVAPTTTSVVLKLARDGRRLVPARFGLDVPGGRLVVNARSETAARLRTFRDAFRSARCVVPSDGYYEWSGRRGARRPYWFHPPGGGLLLLAGLLFDLPAPAFVILTTAANDVVRPVHHRMPAVLSTGDATAWLGHLDAALLRAAPAGALAAREVSPLVNDAANDGPELLESPAPLRQLPLV